MNSTALASAANLQSSAFRLQPKKWGPCAPVFFGADGRTRTGTAYATAPSRRRVYQFHHIGNESISGTVFA